MPHTVPRSHTGVPVRVWTPARRRRRHTAPSVRRAWPTQATICRTTRASSPWSSTRAWPPPAYVRTDRSPGRGRRAPADGPGLGGMPLPPSTTLQECGPCIRGDPALDLEPPRIRGRLPTFPGQAHHRHPRPLQRIDPAHWVGIRARQPVGRMHLQAVEASRRHDVPHAFQPRPHQGGAAGPVIDPCRLWPPRIPSRRDTGPPGCPWTGTRGGVRLWCRRPSGIDGPLERAPPWAPPDGGLGLGWIAVVVGLGPLRSRRARGAARSYAATTHAAAMRLGSHTTSTANAWRWSTARLLTAFSSIPLACAAGRGLERHRRTRTPRAVARPQRLARPAERVFYRQFCNIVGDVLTPPCGVPLYVGWCRQSST